MNRVLSRYFKVLEGKKKAKFLLAKEKGLLQEKIKEAGKILESCELCERRCGINRLKGERGFCGVGKGFRIFGAHTHWGEEPELIPSGTIFLAGCNLHCIYCQNAPQSITPEMGEIWSDRQVAEWIERKAEEGCRNVNFVTPDCYLWNILKALNLVESNIPVVWNSSSYYSGEAAKLIRDIVDVYLLDFRYFSEKCARRLSNAPNYPEVAKRNHLIANKDAEMIIRVLIIPGHIECDAKPILEWVRDNLGPDTRVNIMAQYRPCWRAGEFREINRPLSMEEYREVLEYAEKLGLKSI